jgi:DNA mismatch repair ATPase MutS
VFNREPLFQHLPDLLGHVADNDYTTSRLRQVRDALRSSGDSPRAELERLRRIAHLSDMRRSTVYPIVQLLTLWDQHVLTRLHAWRARNGGSVGDWLDAAADMEALSALATLAHDNPQWCYADVRKEAECIEAKDLGHPAIAPVVRVDNDVTIGPRGTFLLVTGSNMSGKSTLLRSIGLNLVLGRVGAPACAKTLTIPLTVPCVSMRVQDSLSQGVSFFMAELQRVREIVTMAERAPQEGWTCVFLLDEMLHGTNSAERRIAARTVITRLVRAGAIGAVSTHDLQLGSEAELRDPAVRIHFTETVRTDNGRPVMTFDYKIRPGDATSTNALVLLELMGLK